MAFKVFNAQKEAAQSSRQTSLQQKAILPSLNSCLEATGTLRKGAREVNREALSCQSSAQVNSAKSLPKCHQESH